MSMIVSRPNIVGTTVWRSEWRFAKVGQQCRYEEQMRLRCSLICPRLDKILQRGNRRSNCYYLIVHPWRRRQKIPGSFIIDISDGEELKLEFDEINQEIEIYILVEENIDIYQGDSVESNWVRLWKFTGIISRFPQTTLMFCTWTKGDWKEHNL